MVYRPNGLLIASIDDGDPVVYIDDRSLYSNQGEVPEELYSVPIGKGEARRHGKDVTVVATSYMAMDAQQAAALLEKDGIDTEVIDLRSLRPWDQKLVLESVEKTGRLIVADGAWRTCGAAAEIAAQVAERGFDYLKAPIKRVTLPDLPALASSALERPYYVRAEAIMTAIRQVVNLNRAAHATSGFRQEPKRGLAGGPRELDRAELGKSCSTVRSPMALGDRR